MVVLAILALALCLFFALWYAISPQHVWRTFYAWRYRDRDANEPSETTFFLQRIGGIVGSIFAIIGIIVIITLALDGQSKEYERRKQLEGQQLQVQTVGHFPEA